MNNIQQTKLRSAFGTLLAALFAGVLGMMAPLSATAAAESDLRETARDLTVEQNAVYAVQHVQTASSAPSTSSTKPSSALKVTAWVDQADNTYTIGEKVRLFVKTNKDAYVTVLNVGASGNTTVLYPNQYQANNRVPANRVVEIPAPGSAASIAVFGPVGNELIKVVASTAPTNPSSFFGTSGLMVAGVFKSVTGGARTAARDLQVTMDTIQTQNPGAEWDSYNKVIHTVAGPQVPISTFAPAASANPVFVVASTPGFANTGGCAPQASTAGLTLATDKQVYSVGEPMQVAVSTDRTCHLTLVNYKSGGQVSVLFPNQLQPNNLLQAGQTILLPGQGTGLQLTVTGPAGVENLVAVCSNREAPVFGSPYNFAQVFPTVANRGRATRDLGLALDQPAHETAQAMVGVLVMP